MDDVRVRGPNSVFLGVVYQRVLHQTTTPHPQQTVAPLLPWNPASRLRALVADARCPVCNLTMAEHGFQVMGRAIPRRWSPPAPPRPPTEDDAQVAQQVHISHDWDLSVGLMSHAVDVWAPLLAGVTPGELRALFSMARSEGMIAPSPGARELFNVLKARPDRMLHRVRYSTGQLADAPLGEWEVRHGAKVRVYTTRGGVWPEVREVPECSPGWSWGQTVQGIVDKHAGEADPEVSAGLLSVDGGAPAGDWVRSLFV